MVDLYGRVYSIILKNVKKFKCFIFGCYACTQVIYSFSSLFDFKKVELVVCEIIKVYCFVLCELRS
jgi:hypothetical protein